MSSFLKTFSPLLMLLVCQLTANAQDKSLLWKVSGNGLSQPSYLYGTIHIACKSEQPFSQAVTDAFAATSTLCEEIDLTSPDGPQEVMKLLMSGDQQYSLKSSFDTADYTKLNNYLQETMKFGLDKLDKAKPLLVTSILLQQRVTCKDVTAPDKELATMAQQRKIPVVALETMALQMGLFDSIPDKKEAEMIMRMLDDIQGEDKAFLALTKAYQEQDLDKLYSLVMDDPDMKNYQDILLFNRNTAWIPKLKPLITAGPVFVAVGAAHLAGDKGLIALLRKEGYKVEAVK